VLERAFSRSRLALHPKPSDLEVGDTETIKSCVLAGLGIGFLSRWSIQRELLNGTMEVIPLPDLRIIRTFSWAAGSGGISGQAAAFRRHAVQEPPVPPA